MEQNLLRIIKRPALLINYHILGITISKPWNISKETWLWHKWFNSSNVEEKYRVNHKLEEEKIHKVINLVEYINTDSNNNN